MARKARKRRIKKNRKHRTSIETLQDLTSEDMFLDARRPREDVLGSVDLGNVGLHISRYLARRFGSDREEGIRKCSLDSARILGQMNSELDEMRETVIRQKAEIEELKSASTDAYAVVTDKSLEEQVAFLQERETFIEQSENVLFDKAQHLQEWEARLEQAERGQASTASMESVKARDVS